MLNVSAGQYLSFYAFFINIHLLNGSISKYMMLYWLPVFSLELGYQTGATNTKTANKQKNKYQIHFSYSYVYLGSPILDRVASQQRTVPPSKVVRSPHRTGDHVPPLLNNEQIVAGSLTSQRMYLCKGYEAWPTFYHPYPRRLESLTACRGFIGSITKN